MRGCAKPFPSRETEHVAQIFTPGAFLKLHREGCGAKHNGDATAVGI
jgi:hypothetical protein